MDKKLEILRRALSQIYVKDEHLQRKVLDIFAKEEDLEEEEGVLVSRLAGFVYSYVKNNLCEKDELAWELFISMFSGLFHDHLKRYRGMRDDSLRDEVIQAFLHHIMKKCEDGRFNPSTDHVKSFRSYIMTAFRNFTTNYLQRNMVSFEALEDLEPLYAESSSSPELSWCDRILLIMESHEFTLEERLIIKLKCEGYRQKEIAVIIGKSEAYISRKFRALVVRLRDYLSGRA